MAETKGIKIKFEADASPVKSALSQVERTSKTLTKQLKDIDKLLEFDPTNITLLAQKQDILKKSIANTTEQLKGMEDAQEDITKGYTKWQQNQETIEKNNRAIASLSAQLEEAKQSSESLEEYEKASQKVKELTKSIGELQKQQKDLSKDPMAVDEATYQRYITNTEALRINLQQLGTLQSQVNAEIADGGRSAEAAALAEQRAARAAESQAKAEAERKKAAEQAAKADERAKKASQEYKAALDKLKKAANDVKNDIKGMATAVSTGIAAVGSAVAAGTAATTNVGMEFTKSMSNVQALSGATADELAALKAAASDAGANTSKTASEAADALGYMALAGWDTEQMLTGLMPVLRASEAGAMDLASCSDLVTDSMSAMGIAVGDLQHYLDVCTKTQSSSNTSMEQLLQAYVVCGGMLKKLNVPLEESAALLGTLANRGIKGAEAGTALNSILVNLIGANKNAASAMKDMGVSAFDSQGRFIGLEKTLSLVQSKLDEYGDNTEKITQLEAKLGGKTQLDTLQALLSGVNEEYGSLNESLLDCNGSLEATAKTMQDNLSGDIVSLQSALEGVENTIYSSLETPFREAAQNVTREMRDLNKACSEGELADSIKKMATSLSELMTKAAKFAADDAFPTLIKWLDWVATHSDSIISAITGMGAAWAVWKIGTFASHILEMVNALKAYQAAATSATLVQAEMNATAIANPYVLVATAIAAVVAATVSFVKAKSDELKASREAEAALSDETTALKEQAEALKEQSKETEKNIQTIDHNADTVQSLWNEVKLLVDEEGKAIGSSEGLESAISRLNAISGENIEVVNGQITGYKELKASMDDMIESQRKQAKLDYLKDDYAEAIYNKDQAKKQQDEVLKQRDQFQKELDEANKKGEEAVKAYNAYLNDPSNFSAKDWGFKDLDEIDTARYFDTYDLEKQVRDLNIQQQSLEEIIAEYENTIQEYEGIANSIDDSSVMDKNEAIAYGFQQDAKKIADESRKNAELAAMGVKQSWEDLVSDLEDLDSNLAIHSITEEDYWSERRKLLEESQYKESEDWWKYYDAVTDHYDKLSETEKAAQDEKIKTQKEKDKKALEDKIDALKLKEETEDSYTKEMLYNEMEILIAGLDKESDLYKKYNEEIIKGRKALADETSKTIKEGLKTDVSEIEKEIKEVSSKYQTSVKKLLSDKETYFNKLFDTSSFTSKSSQTVNGQTADVFSLSDPKDALKKLNTYDKALDKLKQRGVSDNVLSWIDTLDMETAQNTIDVLNKMSDKKLQAYSDNFDKLKNKAAEMAGSKYDPQIEALNNEFVDKVNSLIGMLPNAAENAGVQTAQGFISGLTGSNEDISTAVSEFTSNIIEQIKSDLDIHSPSKETEELGEYTAKGFLEGFTGQSTDGAAEDFTSSFIAKLAEKDPDIRAAMEDTFVGNISEVLGNMEALTNASLERIAAAVSSKLPTLPDITKLSLPSFNDVSKASNTNSLAEISAKLDVLDDHLDKLDKLDSIIQAITILSASGQTVKLQLELAGQLTADMNNITAIISQKFNNLSIQTGKQVFSY